MACILRSEGLTVPIYKVGPSLQHCSNFGHLTHVSQGIKT